MIIFEKHKTVFHHIPRTGGVSLSRLFTTHCGGKFSYPFHGAPGPGKLDDYRKVIVIREPADRLISLWRYACRTKDADAFIDYDYRHGGRKGKPQPTGTPVDSKLFGVSLLNYVKSINRLDFRNQSLHRRPWSRANISTYVEKLGFDDSRGDIAIDFSNLADSLRSKISFIVGDLEFGIERKNASVLEHPDLSCETLRSEIMTYTTPDYEFILNLNK